MKKSIFLLMLPCVLMACSVSQRIQKNPILVDDFTFLIQEVSTDPDYGFTADKPIKVGGTVNGGGPLNERRYLNALAGPDGESIMYDRKGNCCGFKTDNGFMGYGLLDVYKVTWKGSSDTLTLYINMYDYSTLYAPVGFTIR